MECRTPAACGARGGPAVGAKGYRHAVASRHWDARCRGELQRIGEPIDLVGHDWGAILAVRAVSLEPGIARSWTAGGALLDAEYEWWHRVAKLWQTPVVGEQMMGQVTPEALAAALTGARVPHADAAEAASHLDDTMKRCILSPYRSAVRAGAEWEPDLSRVAAPGLVLWGADDPDAAPRFGGTAREPHTGALRLVPGLLALVAAVASRRSRGRARSALVVRAVRR